MAEFKLSSNTGWVCRFLCPYSDQIYIWFYKSYITYLVTRVGKVTHTVTLQPTAGDDDFIVDMCTSQVDGTLWSVNTNGRIQQVRQDSKKVQSIKYFIGKKDKPESLCVTRKQEVVVGMNGSEQVVILTITGKVSRVVEAADVGLSNIATRIIQCNKTGRFAITDTNKISVVDENFSHLYTIYGDTVTSADGNNEATGYMCQNTFYPMRTCFDADGNLFVVDYKNYSVIMFSSNGQYIRTITMETEHKKSPCAINSTPRGTLLMGRWDHVFKEINYK